ncbi:MAG: hypothetical protein JXQ67_08020 [Campylobacterales bacterium]|nr:hypothetical protein [Campylobacterales bacterium]
MAGEETKLYLELQMEELKATYGISEDEKSEQEKLKEQRKQEIQRAKNAEIAKMYDDAAEYEADLEGFKAELEIVHANELSNIATALREAFPDEERDFAQELDTIVQTGWAYFVNEEQSHPQEQLEIVNNTTFAHLLPSLQEAYPDYKSFEKEIRELLTKRWENLIAIKEEHIKQELAEIKTTGLKPKYVKRVYQQFHGIIK